MDPDKRTRLLGNLQNLAQEHAVKMEWHTSNSGMKQYLTHEYKARAFTAFAAKIVNEFKLSALIAGFVSIGLWASGQFSKKGESA